MEDGKMHMFRDDPELRKEMWKRYPHFFLSIFNCQIIIKQNNNLQTSIRFALLFN